MLIRHATEKDIKKIVELYNVARLFMSKNGNPTQWTDNYPSRNNIIKDLESQSIYVVEHEKEIVATFFFKIGPESDYNKLIYGKWISDRPYGVVHRLASSGAVKGISKFVFDWCFKQINSIRLDTHFDNVPMQKALKKYGFHQTGIVLIPDDDNKPYLAYQLDIN